MEDTPTPKFMGLNITPRFAEALGMAQEKQGKAQMSHTQSSTQDREYSPAGFEQNLYEKSDIYRTTKGAITAPMRALEGELDPYSPQGVEEAMGTAGMGLVGSMPGGASGAGSLGVVRQPLKENYLRLLKGEVEELYRETSGTSFLNMFGGSNSMGTPRLHFAETPEMALGQGKNKGITFKISTENLYGKVNRDKPALEQSYLNGMGEFLVDAQPTDILKNLKEVEITPEAFIGLSRGEKARLNLELSRLESKGITVKRVAKKEGLGEISSPIQELEAKVQEDLKKLDTTGYDMLPGTSGKRDSDPQPSVIEKMMKKHPELVKSDPTMLQKYEIYLRHVKKLPEDEVDKVMMPLWSTYLRNEKAGDSLKDETHKRSLKRTTEADPMVEAITKLSSLVEAMGKPKTVVRDANGKIVGVA